MTIKISKNMTDYIDSLPGIAACRDQDCVYLYANEAYGKTHGLRHHFDIIGRTSAELPSGAAACAALFDEQDRQVMNSGQELKILDIHPYAKDTWSAHLYIKRPWFDENQKIIGTIGWGIDITHAYTAALNTQLIRVEDQPLYSDPFDNPHAVRGPEPDISLSPREREVLHLTLRGKTAKLAAAALGLSYRTVEQYVESIKLKFGVRSKTELIEIAVARGYLNRLSMSLFSRQLSMVLSAQTRQQIIN
jgi:DNA-binding CsgD family transcriptional regulator